MFKRSLLAAAVLFPLCAAIFLLAQAPATPDMPPGPMQEKARTACMECHDARITLQQRLDKGAWTREVDKMIRWGAVVDPKDRDAMIDYFSANFPPEKPLEPMPRAAKSTSQKQGQDTEKQDAKKKSSQKQ
jgi:hypothetical protein